MIGVRDLTSTSIVGVDELCRARDAIERLDVAGPGIGLVYRYDALRALVDAPDPGAPLEALEVLAAAAGDLDALAGDDVLVDRRAVCALLRDRTDRLVFGGGAV